MNVGLAFGGRWSRNSDQQTRTDWPTLTRATSGTSSPQAPATCFAADWSAFGSYAYGRTQAVLDAISAQVLGNWGNVRTRGTGKDLLRTSRDFDCCRCPEPRARRDGWKSAPSLQPYGVD